MHTIRIAQLQLPVPVDTRQALAAAATACQDAVAKEVDLVALPEMFCCPYDTKNFPLYAEEEGDSVWTACSEIARNNGIYLSAGSVPERDSTGRVYNTAYVFDRTGRRIAKHRKMHLFDINVKNGQRFQESDTLSAGKSVTTFDTEFGVFGLCVCYDFRFPELGRLMALNGAKVILVPAAFNMTTGPAHWELMFRSQALNNQVYAIGTAPARDPSAPYVSWGHSIIVDPWGGVVHQMDEMSGTQITELDLGFVADIRAQLPLLKHRRTDVYTLTEHRQGDPS